MSEHIHERHNKSLILYHLVCLIKYGRSVLTETVEFSLDEVCKQISSRYEIHFLEIGGDENHVHYLIQSVPVLSCEVIVRTIERWMLDQTLSLLLDKAIITPNKTTAKQCILPRWSRKSKF